MIRVRVKVEVEVEVKDIRKWHIYGLWLEKDWGRVIHNCVRACNVL